MSFMYTVYTQICAYQSLYCLVSGFICFFFCDDHVNMCIYYIHIMYAYLNMYIHIYFFLRKQNESLSPKKTCGCLTNLPIKVLPNETSFTHNYRLSAFWPGGFLGSDLHSRGHAQLALHRSSGSTSTHRLPASS